MTATVTPAKPTAAQRKQQKKLADERQARQDAAVWADVQHPREVGHIAHWGRCGTKSEPWNAIPCHPLNPLLKANGRVYAVAFLDEVDVRWQWIKHAWGHLMYTTGIDDGQRWAVSLATPDQLRRLRSALQNCGCQLLIDAEGRDRQVLTSSETRDHDLPAAHWLLTWILGCDVYQPRVIHDEDGYEGFEYDSHRQEFKSFWQPFFAEPMEEVLDSVEIGRSDVNCKLLEPDYIRGFIDGATGLSKHLREDHPE